MMETAIRRGEVTTDDLSDRRGSWQEKRRGRGGATTEGIKRQLIAKEWWERVKHCPCNSRAGNKQTG